MALLGKCLCGKVRYQISEGLIDADHCHCSICRRHHGAAFATYGQFSDGDFSWLSGAELVKSYNTDSGAGWCFCSECGATLAGSEKGKVTSVTLASIVGDPGVKPASHIFVGSKACWYDICDDLIQHSHRAPIKSD